ncbi:MAG: polymerase III subunit beta protein [Parcubacteria group bacterium GW2011_GWA2_39_18]|nr:MAG: polymerase III subunit beta protein [Parcubacteria group bacterium GW2011_GWA2_39_18]
MIQITFTKDNLIKGLQKAERFTGKNTTLPILSSVLLKVEKNKAKLYSTDLEVGAIFEISAKTEEIGSVIIPVKSIIQFVQNINNSNVVFKIKKDKLVVEGDNYKTSFNCLEADDFPVIPDNIKEKLIRIESEKILEGLINTVPIINFNSSRPEISGIFICVQKNSIKFVGTDSFRLTEIEASTEQKSEKETSLIMPLKLGQELIKLFQEEKNEVEICSNQHQIMIKGKNFTVVSRLIDGSYPPYEQIIPHNNKTKLILNKNSFKKGLEMASVFSGKMNDMKFSFDFGKKTLKIYSQNSEVGDFSYEIDFEGEGESQEIVLNWKFFLDGLNKIEGEKFILEINNAINPVIIKGLKNNRMLYLLMPIRSV